MKVMDLPSSSMRERLIEEGRVQSALRHPNIASVTDLILVNGAPALIMEYVNGPALDAVLAQGGVSLQQADFLARSVITGMVAAHKHGLVHRDLKPSNIMLSVNEGEFVPKIIDFGLVKNQEQASAVQTRTGMTMGTPSYMAPEQVRDAKHIDQRADVFALGAICTSWSPADAFIGTDTFEIFRSIADGRYVIATSWFLPCPNILQRRSARLFKRIRGIDSRTARPCFGRGSARTGGEVWTETLWDAAKRRPGESPHTFGRRFASKPSRGDLREDLYIG